MNPTQQLHDMGQSLWLDNISRGMLNSGLLQQYLDEDAVSGLTSNPTIFEHAIASTDDYDDAIRRKTAAGLSGEALFFELAIEDLARAAELFRPTHERTDQVDGWVSLEVSPLLAHNAATTVREAKRLAALAALPNVFIKIPGTSEGALAIEEAIFAGVAINVTLLFSADQYRLACDAYLRGVERRVAAGLNPAVASVASLFVSRWDRAANDRLPHGLRDRLGLAVAQQTYQAYREMLASPRWLRLANAGARPQRLLWASTGTKTPEASDVLYISGLIAPFTINTIPDETLRAFRDHGVIGNLLPSDGGDSASVLAEIARAGIDVGQLAADLQQQGADAFTHSWRELMESVAAKGTTLATAR